jgi:CubicO group peptidase (beta-lactamase class C family)
MTDLLMPTLNDLARRHALPAADLAVIDARGALTVARVGPTGGLFRLASLTKPFTAATILRLVAAGRLSLEDPLARWYPEFPNAAAIRLRDLLAHRSGLPDYLTARALARRLPFREPPPLAALLQRAARQLGRFAPGLHFAYGGTAFVLAALIAERVTGRAFADLLRDEVTGPLGLAKTFFLPGDPPPPNLLDGRARTFVPQVTLRIKATAPALNTLLHAAGGMVGTAADTAVFLRAFVAGDLLPPDLREAATRLVPLPDSDNPHQTAVGLGMFGYRIAGEPLLGHEGSLPGFSTIAMHAPNLGVTAALLTNTSELPTADLLAELWPVIAPHGNCGRDQ